MIIHLLNRGRLRLASTWRAVTTACGCMLISVFAPPPVNKGIRTVAAGLPSVPHSPRAHLRLPLPSESLPTRALSRRLQPRCLPRPATPGPPGVDARNRRVAGFSYIGKSILVSCELWEARIIWRNRSGNQDNRWPRPAHMNIPTFTQVGRKM